MSDIREIRLVSVLRPDLDDRDVIQESFQEVITDFNTIKTQWNDSIYPLLASLPGQRIRRDRAVRSSGIDPFVNGFDGSQLYMDQASRPNELGGLLHNGTRPKTIKEVVVETYQSSIARVGRVEDLLNQVNIANAAYDDGELRSWIIQLAGETWDPDTLAIGGTFNTANFAGAPLTSSVTLSQRINNMRHLVGVDGELLTLTGTSDLAEILNSNYMVGTTDILAALEALDAQLFLSGAAVSLQGAYDNGSSILITAGNPVSVTSSTLTTGETALQTRGRIDFQDPSTGLGAAAKLLSTYDSVTDLTAMQFYAGGDAVVTTPSDADLMASLEKDVAGVTSYLYLGKKSSTAAAEFANIYGGRETAANGGLARWEIVDTGAGTPIGFTVRTEDLIITSPNFTVTSASAVDITGGSNITVDAGGDLDLTTSGGSLRLISGDSLSLTAAQGVTVNATTLALTENILDITSAGIFTRTAAGVGLIGAGGIQSAMVTAGAYHHVKVAAESANSNALVYAQNTAQVVAVNEVDLISRVNGWGFNGENAAWLNGIVFKHSTTIAATAGEGIWETTVAGDGTIGSIIYEEIVYNDLAWPSATAAVDGLNCKMGSFEATSYAPTKAFFGGPSITTVYIDNIVKAKGKVFINLEADLASLTTTQMLDAYNIDLTASSWTDGTAIIKIVFATALQSANYSVTTGYENGLYTMNLRIQNQLTTGFEILCDEFVTPNFAAATPSGSEPFTVHYQVI